MTFSKMVIYSPPWNLCYSWVTQWACPYKHFTNFRSTTTAIPSNSHSEKSPVTEPWWMWQ